MSSICPPPPLPFHLFLAVFTKEELESALRPVFDAIWQQPDAWPFQEPVNPERLNIPVRAARHCPVIVQSRHVITFGTVVSHAPYTIEEPTVPILKNYRLNDFEVCNMDWDLSHSHTSINHSITETDVR